MVCIENNGVASAVKCVFGQKLGQNLSDMEGKTFARIQKVIWDHLLVHKYIFQCTNIFSSAQIRFSVHNCNFALKNIFVHWETYLCTGKHICALKMYICALKNMPVMCSDQYLCIEIFICALHIWASVGFTYLFGEVFLSVQKRPKISPVIIGYAW